MNGIRWGDNIDGFYGGNSFANQIGITTQVPNVVESVSNNTNSSDRERRIGNRRFYVRKPIVQITKINFKKAFGNRMKFVCIE